MHEGRAPALLDNLLGGKSSPRVDDDKVNVTPFRIALVLAPLFVHFEVLFALGLFKQTKKDLHNDVAKLKAELRLKQKEAKKE